MSVKGQCLCGAVRVRVDADLPPVVACHCSQCRKMTGHYWASVHVPREAVTVLDGGTLEWFSASDIARRGFCKACGSTLFWDPADEDKISISAGVFEAPTGAVLSKHIFAADKGDYYDLNDGLPQRP